MPTFIMFKLEKSDRKLINRLLFPLERLRRKAHAKQFFGLPGSGKTTLAASVVNQCIRREIPVYSNVYIKGAIKIDAQDIWKYDYPVASVMIIDEIGLEFGNRDFKRFPKELIRFFKYHRHHGITLYMFSQEWNDADSKIRGITSHAYQLESFLGHSIAMQYKRKYITDPVTHEPRLGWSDLTFLDRLFPAFKVNRKKYYKMFDSFFVEKTGLAAPTERYS